MLNGIVWNGTVLDIETVLTLNWKSYLLFLSRITSEPSVRIQGPNWRQEKLASIWVSSLAYWIAGIHFKQAKASEEIKVKLNESRLLKFYQVKLLKENSTKNSAEKNFKEDPQLNEPWNISTKQKKKKRKILKFKELASRGFSDKFQ